MQIRCNLKISCLASNSCTLKNNRLSALLLASDLKIIKSNSLYYNGYLFDDCVLVPGWFLSKRRGRTGVSDIKETIDFNALSVGDRVVHKHHGVAEYRGVFDFGDDNSPQERLLLEYSDGGKIYVSIQNYRRQNICFQ